MEISMTLALPRDERSVPVVRRVLKTSLDSLGVLPDVVSDIELALTEACTNALDHAAKGAEYAVVVGVHGDVCRIEVVDRGAGFDAAGVGMSDAATSAEEGRGIQLMRALVDRVEFSSPEQAGTVVLMEKKLEWQPDSILHALEQDLKSGDVS